MRAAIKARLRGVAAGDQSGWLFGILAHEITQPTPTRTHLIDSVLRPRYNQLYEIVDALIGLPADDEQTHLRAHSIMGQIIYIYYLCIRGPGSPPPFAGYEEDDD
jgi:hypothetical protein